MEWKGLFALHYFTKEIIDLKSELEEIEASPNMQQKKKEIQEKLIKIMIGTISDSQKSKGHHFKIFTSFW